MRVVVTRKSPYSRWYIKIIASNGETIMHSQHYFSKSNAVRAANNMVHSTRSEKWILEVPR